MLKVVKFLGAFLTLPSLYSWGRMPINPREGSLLLDQEITMILEKMAAPALKEARIPQNHITLNVLTSPQYNAFATLGNRVFLFSNFILGSRSLGEFLFVMFHELGHVAGKHPLRSLQTAKEASSSYGLSALAGLLAQVTLGGQEQSIPVGVAAAAGLMNNAVRSFLKDRRAHEAAADQLAFRVFEKNNWSLKGVVEGLEFMAQSRASRDDYLQTHPATPKRLESAKEHYARQIRPEAFPEDLQQAFFCLQAKVAAYTLPLAKAELFVRKLPCKPNIKEAARCLMRYRFYPKEASQVLTKLESLKSDYPHPEFLEEAKATILIAEKRYEEGLRSLESLRKSRHQNLALLLASAFSALKAFQNQQIPIDTLQKIQRDCEAFLFLPSFSSNKNAFLLPAFWRTLGEVYEKTGENANASACLAERFASLGKPSRQVLSQIARALGQPDLSPTYRHRLVILKESLERSKKSNLRFS